MASENLKQDQDRNNVAGAVTNDANLEVRMLRVDPTTNALLVQVSGGVADGSPVSGNPILVAGEDPSGNVAYLQTAADGDLIMHQHSASTALADAVGNTMHIPVNDSDFGFLATPSVLYQFNGTTWDRVRGDTTYGLDVDVTRIGTVATKFAAESTSSDYSESASTTEQSSRVVKSSAGRLYSLSVSNENASTRYLQLFNSTSLPGDGAVPVFCPVEVPSGKQASITFFDINGKYFSTGITAAMSSTQNSLTIAGTDHLFCAYYL